MPKKNRAAEQARMQTKGFTKWANSHLKLKGIKMDDITKDLKDGLSLCHLLSILTGETVKPPNSKAKLKKKSSQKIRSLENITTALNFIQKAKKINLEGLIGSLNIYEGDVTHVLGLVWTLILRMSIVSIELDGVAGEKGLLLWCQRVTTGYHKGGKSIKNFSRSWKSGLPFVAIIHHFRPDLIEFNEDASKEEACESAFSVAEGLGITRILDVEDICDTPVPDKKIVMTYVAEYFKKFAVMEAADSKARAVAGAVKLTQRHEQLMQEYETIAKAFEDLVAQQEADFENRDFGNSVESVQGKITEFIDYLSKIKPEQQAKLLQTGNVLGSLHASQQPNERPNYVPTISQESLKAKFEQMEESSAAYEAAMNSTLAKFIQYRLITEQFNGKAAMMEKVATTMNAMFDNFDLSDNSMNNLTACQAAYNRYVQAMKRYDTVFATLPDLVGQVEEPYVDAATVRTRYQDLVDSLASLKEKAEKFNQTATDQLAEVKRLRELASKYRNDAGNFGFEVNTLNQKAAAMDQLTTHAAIMEQLPELRDNIGVLSTQFDGLEEAGLVSELPEHLLIDTLKDKLANLEKMLQNKKKALEAALEAAKAEAAAKAAELGDRHDGLQSEYEQTANDIATWVASKHALFTADPTVTTVPEVENLTDNFKAYRNEEKPAKQTQLFNNQNIVGQLHTSQRQHGMPLYSPPDDISPSTLGTKWSEMETAETTYEDSITRYLASYKDQRRYTADHDKAANNVNEWAAEKKALFTDFGTEVPESDRTNTLERRLKAHSVYEKEVGRSRTLDKMKVLAGNIRPPYESHDRIAKSQQETELLVSDLAMLAKNFGAANKNLLEAENELVGKGKQFNNDAEGVVFITKYAETVLDDPVDAETSERAKQCLVDHQDVVENVVEPLKKALEEVLVAAKELQDAGRADYINEQFAPNLLQEGVDKITNMEAERARQLQAQVSKYETDEQTQRDNVASTIQEQINDYNNAAKALKDCLMQQNEKFGVTDFVTVEDCEDATKQLEGYRGSEKPTHQTSLLSLSTKLGTLHSLQCANKLELFQPEEDLTYANVMATWDDLTHAEAAYEKTLLDTTDAYKRMRNCVEEFNGTNKLISDWAGQKAAFFAEPVPCEEAKLSPADAVHQINGRLQAYDTYVAQYARYQPVAGALPALLEIVKEPYKDAPASHNALQTLQDKLASLDAAAAAYKNNNDDLLANEVDLQTKSTKYVRDAESALFDIQESTDSVSEPFHASDVSSVEAQIAKHKAFLESKGGPASLSERVEGMLPDYTLLKETPNSDDKKLCPSGAEIDVVRAAANKFKEAADASGLKLDEALINEKKKDAAAQAFGTAANAFKEKCTDQHAAINGVTGTFDEKIAAIKALQSEIAGCEGDLQACDELQRACDCVAVTTNPYTNETPRSLHLQHDQAKQLASRVVDEAESAKLAEAASKLTPQQAKMLRRVFNQFDEGGDDTVSFDEFYQAANAMGLVIDEATATSLFKGAVGEADTMSFEQFSNVMEAQLTCGATKSSVLSAFAELADNKPTIAAPKVKRFFGNEAEVFKYMNEHMKSGDYKSFTADIFTR